MDVIDIESIKAGLPGISSAWCATIAEACIVSLSRHNHTSGVELNLIADKEKKFSLSWKDSLTEQLDRTWKDQEEATEYGAVCLGVQIALKMTDYTVIERSAKTTGFDYWLGTATDDQLLFEKKARLEVSGIFNGDVSKIKSRYKIKIKQTKQSESTGLPAFVAIVGFSKPMAKFGYK